jgi:hypothetical protein
VDDGGERLDAVDHPRAGADHDAVGVDGPDRHPGQRVGHHQRLFGRAGQVVAARRDHHQLRLRRPDVGPRRFHRGHPQPGRHRLAARRGDQIRDPVTRGERRIHPLHDRHARTAEPGHARRDRRQPLVQPRHQRRGPLGNAGPLPDGHDRVQYPGQRMRVQGQHVRVAAQVVQGLVHVPGRERAHPAQVLGQDQVGRQRGQGPRVQRVQVLPRGQLGPDVPVDVTRGHGAGIQAADHDRLLRAGGRRLVALEGDSGQVIAQPERVDDLCRRRQQRNQAHRSRLIRRYRGSRSSSRT